MHMNSNPDYEPYAQRRRRALEFIDAYITGHGYPPSGREVAAALGCGRSRTFDILEKMEREGLITRPRYNSAQRISVGRTMRLTEAAMVMLKEEM
jgi:DNA-binding MarR family transcriptional regulator